MAEGLGLMKMANALGAHASQRQSLLARNVANADTPGYRAADLADFKSTLDAGRTALKATRPTHLFGGTETRQAERLERTDEASPNGNNVSVETEMMHAAEVRHQHEMALSVYSTGRDVLRASLGR